jgi:hypothetical protein
MYLVLARTEDALSLSTGREGGAGKADRSRQGKQAPSQATLFPEGDQTFDALKELSTREALAGAPRGSPDMACALRRCVSHPLPQTKTWISSLEVANQGADRPRSFACLLGYFRYH